MKIWVDVDGVQADLVQVFLDLLREQTGRSHTHEDVTCWNFTDCVASHEEVEAVWEAMSSRNLIATMPDLDDGRIGVERLRSSGHWVGALTSPRPTASWLMGRMSWLLDRRFMSNEIVFTSDKTHVPGDILIEDSAAYANAWVQMHPDGVALLLDRPWNRDADLVRGVSRCYGWDSVLTLVNWRKAWDIGATGSATRLG